MNKAVFLDRDGTINQEIHYLTDPRDLELLPSVAEAIKMLNEAKFEVIIVTNQSAIARGLLTKRKLEEIHNRLLKILNDKGAKIDAIYYCPHHPDENCTCRKPKSGLIFKASKEHSIDLSESYVVGDKLIDIKSGRNAGCKAILVLTGYGKTELPEKIEFGTDFQYIADNLYDAAVWIVKNINERRETTTSQNISLSL